MGGCGLGLGPEPSESMKFEETLDEAKQMLVSQDGLFSMESVLISRVLISSLNRPHVSERKC